MTDNLFADVSSNNASFNAAPYASAGHLVIAIKATEGLSFVNPKYAAWVHDAHNHGLGVLHYHFARPEDGHPDRQAEHFWSVVKEHFRRPGDFVVVDTETDTPANGRNFTLEYDKHLRQVSGTHPVLYTFLSYFQEGHLTISSDQVWLAAWGRNQPGRNWDVPGPTRLWAWQFTDGRSGPPPHSFAGIPGSSDGSRLNPNTVATLRKELRR